MTIHFSDPAIAVCSNNPVLASGGRQRAESEPDGQTAVAETRAPQTPRMDPSAALQTELATVNTRIGECLQLVDACEAVEGRVRALRSTWDAVAHTWSQMDAEQRPPRPAEPAELVDAQTQYMKLRDRSRDARQELIGLRARDRAIRDQLARVTAEHDNAAADTMVRIFRRQLDEVRPTFSAIGVECRRIRDLHPNRTTELMHLVDEIRGRLWV